MISKDKTYRTKDGHQIENLDVWFDGDFWGKIMPNPNEQRPPIFTSWQANGTCRAFKHPEWDLTEVRPRIKRTVWLNVHVNRSVIAHNFREEADNLFCKDVAPRIACIKVDLDFEEGEGL